jgi:O-antigen/teichoic acid export membrane protein
MNRASALFYRVDFIGALASGLSFIAVNVVLQILLVPLYLHSLGKADFGILMIILSSINFLGFGIFGLTGQVLRTLSRHATNQDDEQFSTSYTRARCVFDLYGIVVALCGMAVFLMVSHSGDSTARPGDSLALTALFAAAYFVVSIDFGIARIGLSALHHQMAANCFQVISLLVFALVVFPWMLSGGGMAGVTGAMLAGVITARCVTGFFIYVRQLPVRWSSQPRFLSSALREYGGSSSRLYMIYGAIFIITQSDSVILGLISGPETVADFILIWKVAEVLLLILSRVPEHLQPVFARASGEHKAAAADIYRRSMFWLRIAALCAGIGYAILGPWIVSAWVGAAKAPQDHLGYILAGGALFWLAVARVPAALANIQGGDRQRALVRLAATEIALKIVLMIVLVRYVAEYAPLIAINLLHLGGCYYLYARLPKPFFAAEKAP